MGNGTPAAAEGVMTRCPTDDPDLPLTLLFDRRPQTVAVFLGHRMLCFGCPFAPFHTVIDACAEYALDEAAFRAELRAAT
jgi:hybrid cluster-associated redox disulfide protein